MTDDNTRRGGPCGRPAPQRIAVLADIEREIGNNPMHAATVGDVVGAFKSLSTVEYTRDENNPTRRGAPCGRPVP